MPISTPHTKRIYMAVGYENGITTKLVTENGSREFQNLSSNDIEAHSLIIMHLYHLISKYSFLRLLIVQKLNRIFKYGFKLEQLLRNNICQDFIRVNDILNQYMREQDGKLLLYFMELKK